MLSPQLAAPRAARSAPSASATRGPVPMAWRFTQVDVVGKQPPPRHMHASAVIDGALYVVGGQHRLDVLQDAWTLRIDDRPYEWRKLKLQKAGRLPDMARLRSCVLALANTLHT